MEEEQLNIICNLFNYILAINPLLVLELVELRESGTTDDYIEVEFHKI